MGADWHTEALQQELKVQIWKSQPIHFHNSFTLERRKCLHKNNSLEQLPWLYVTGMAQHSPGFQYLGKGIENIWKINSGGEEYK